MRASRMTAEQAHYFERTSEANAATVRAVLPCGCEPYQDVFTFKRWLALGYVVNRGEHAIKLPNLKIKDIEDKQTGESRTVKIFGRSCVFCRHQVHPLHESASAAVAA